LDLSSAENYLYVTGLNLLEGHPNTTLLFVQN